MYPTITDDEKARAQEVLNGGEPEKIIQTKMMGNPSVAIKITHRLLQCLQPGQWLNDEVINVWLAYVADRNQQLNDATAGCMPSIYILSTQAYTRMCEIVIKGKIEGVFDYAGVRRWTRNVDLFGKDMIFIPLHQGHSHWALAVVNMHTKKIQYFDSDGGHGKAKAW
jgi:sentrin-specific protease 1